MEVLENHEVLSIGFLLFYVCVCMHGMCFPTKEKLWKINMSSGHCCFHYYHCPDHQLDPLGHHAHGYLQLFSRRGGGGGGGGRHMYVEILEQD